MRGKSTLKDHVLDMASNYEMLAKHVEKQIANDLSSGKVDKNYNHPLFDRAVDYNSFSRQLKRMADIEGCAREKFDETGQVAEYFDTCPYCGAVNKAKWVRLADNESMTVEPTDPRCLHNRGVYSAGRRQGMNTVYFLFEVGGY